MSLLRRIFGTPALDAAIRESEAFTVPAPRGPRVIHYDDLPPARFRYNNGEKFPGGFGETSLLVTDYWTLRARSAELFERNLFARGIIRRLVTNVISTGLSLESTPNETLLGGKSLAEWAEDVEARFGIWAKDPLLVDDQEQLTFGAMQAAGFREALVSGDVLAIRKDARSTGTPRIRLMRGELVQTPFPLPEGKRIEHGVELDESGRHVAYWITQRDGTFKRLPAWGEKSGRRLAWLVYASDHRLDDVRGQPMLTLILQSLKELDRYRDATTRKAVLNSFLSLWVEKTEDKPGSRALAAGGAVRVDTMLATGSDGTERSWTGTEFLPGATVHELQHGEKIHAHGSQGTDEKYGDFEEAMIQGIAWALEIPPEVLRLSFSSNYSASKAAENNFSVYLYTARTLWGEQFCQPIFVDWLLSETLRGNIQTPGLLEAWRNPSDYVTFGAWTLSDWTGHVKPSVDPVKQVEGFKRAIAEGLTTRARSCREFSGMKFSRVVRDLEIENEALAKANEPLAPPAPELPAEFGGAPDEADDEPGKKDSEDAA